MNDGAHRKIDRNRDKGQRGAECGEQDQHDGEDKPLLAQARRQRRQQDLCSFSAPVAPRAGIPARAPRDVPFCAIVGNFNFYARLLSPFR